jgi:hypothetical protein
VADEEHLDQGVPPAEQRQRHRPQAQVHRQRVREDRFVSDFMLLGIGEAMVRISTPKQVPATKVKISE